MSTDTKEFQGHTPEERWHKRDSFAERPARTANDRLVAAAPALLAERDELRMYMEDAVLWLETMGANGHFDLSAVALQNYKASLLRCGKGGAK